MTSEIKPKMVDGKAACDEQCPQFNEYADDNDGCYVCGPHYLARVAELESELAEAQTTIRLAERSIAAYDADLTRVRRERDQLRNDHQRVVGERDRARRDLQQALESNMLLANARDDLQQQLDAAERHGDILVAENDDLQQQLAEAHAVINEVESLANLLEEKEGGDGIYDYVPIVTDIRALLPTPPKGGDDDE